MMVERRIRVLLAKTGLDGHDVGAKIIARALSEAGFDVTYTGLRKSAEQIVHRAVELNVDVLGVSLLSGSHLPLCRRIKPLLAESGLDRVVWIVGGVIPDEDVDTLKGLGVDGVFPVGTPLESVVAFIREKVA